MRKNNTNRFDFGVDFQELILKYTVIDKKGYKAIELYEDTYFTLLSHQVIAYALKKYYKQHKRIPDKTFFKEHLRYLYFNQKKIFKDLKEDDRKEIDEILDRIYKGSLSDSESSELMSKVVAFARFISFKEVYEEIDITNFDSYQSHISKLQESISIGEDSDSSKGTFLIAGIKDRAYKRNIDSTVTPTPYWQWNRLLNGKGITRNAVVLVASEAKRFKTGFLINLCLACMRKRKRIIYFDLENGEGSLTNRSEQSIINITQEELLTGKFDGKLIKLFRKYKRIGAELFIRRLPAYTTTIIDLQAEVDRVKRETGITFHKCIIDYADLMGATSKMKDETARINDAYVDIKNFTKYNDFEETYTASHVTREGAKHRDTKYVQNDLAKCIDKIRHCEIAIGLNENDSEREAGIIRAEIIEQRNGKPEGRILFFADIEKQRMREFTREEVTEYYSLMEQENPDEEDRRRRKQKDARENKKSLKQSDL